MTPAAPSPWTWHGGWEEAVVVILAAIAYTMAARRNPPTATRVAVFVAGLLVVLAVSVTPVATLALNYLLSAHLLQNVALAEWAPALTVAGLAPGTAAGLARAPLLRRLLHPVVALPLWLVAYGLWHVPAAYDAALRNELLLHLEHATYFATGVLLWWPVFQSTPTRLSSGAKSAYLFAAFVLASPIGLLLAFVPNPIYAFYEAAPRVWGLDPLTDQQIAGVLMAVSEAIVFFAAFVWFFARFLAEEEAGYSPPHAEP